MDKLSNANRYEIGTRIAVAKLSEPDDSEYYSKIQNIDKGIIYIDIPYDGKSFFVLMRGERIRVKYISEGVAYVFNSEFLGKYKETENLLFYKIKEPDEDDIERIQLRNFVRISLIMDMKYKEKEGDWIKATMLDISCGGIKMAVNKKIEVGTELIINLSLPIKKRIPIRKSQYNLNFKARKMSEDDDVSLKSKIASKRAGKVEKQVYINKENIEVKAEVVRCSLVDDQTKLFHVGLKFFDLNKGIEDAICAFVFKKQMEQIRKR